MAPLLSSWIFRGAPDVLYGMHRQQQAQNTTHHNLEPARSINPIKHMSNLMIGSEEHNKQHYQLSQGNKHLSARTSKALALSSPFDFGRDKRDTEFMAWTIFTMMVLFLVFVLLADVYQKSPLLQRWCFLGRRNGPRDRHTTTAIHETVQYSPFQNGTASVASTPSIKEAAHRPSTLDDAEKGQAGHSSGSGSVTPNGYGNEKGKENILPAAVGVSESASAPPTLPMVNGDDSSFRLSPKPTEFSLSYNTNPAASQNGEGPSNFH